MLNKLTPEAENFVSRLEDKANIVLERNIVLFTEFVDPYLKECGFNFLKRLPGINFEGYGGIPDAERQRIVLCPEFTYPEIEMAQISLIKFEGKLQYINYSHRDFLGALLGQGIKREKVGDLYPFVNGFVVALSNDIAEYFLLNLLKIKGVPLRTEMIQIDTWEPPKQMEKTLSITVSSLRLDTILAHGFGIARSKASLFIKGGKVKVNWRIIEDIDYQCSENDTISLRGKGRIKIINLAGETRKGRLKVTIKRYE